MNSTASKFYYSNDSGEMNPGITYLVNADDTKGPHRTIYSVPMIDIGDLLLDYLIRHNKKNVFFIHHENSKNARDDIRDKINEIEQTNDGAIIICLHCEVEFIRPWPNRNKWQLVMDGDPQCDVYLGIPAPHDKELLTKLFCVSKSQLGDGSVYALGMHKPGSEGYLPAEYEMVSNGEVPDDLNVNMQRILRGIGSGRSVLVNAESWNQMMKGQLTGDLPIICMIHPRIYQRFLRTIIMSYKFKKSMLYDWFRRKHKIIFHELSKIPRK